MKHLMMIGAGLMMVGSALAAPSSNVAWDRDTAALLKSANAAHGKDLALTCAGCHGADGVSVNPQWPHLAGQDIGTTYKQMTDYKDGKRDSAIMKGLVSAFTPQEMVDVAAYYAAMPLPPAKGDAGAAPRLATHGDTDGLRLLPACDGCHGEDGGGNHRSWGMPVLAGQSADYLKATLGAYKSGARSNDVYSVMRAIAKELSDADIDELAAWYQANGG